jgi:predicted acylesterase/phospholipase RssA
MHTTLTAQEASTDTSPGSGIALSLGSSFRGYYAHCGFLAEFSRSGIIPGRLAGSSAGAISALLYAQGMRGEDLVDFILPTQREVRPLATCLPFFKRSVAGHGGRPAPILCRFLSQ